MDIEVWRWIWTIFAVVMLLGEIVSLGFFLLPFGVGGALAAAAAWLGWNAAAQWTFFFVGTGAAFLVVHRFIRGQDKDEQTLVIGPERYVGEKGIILETVDMEAHTGLVRVQADEWRAITDGGAIAEGTEVEVLEVRGTRLVVAPAAGAAAPPDADEAAPPEADAVD